MFRGEESLAVCFSGGCIAGGQGIERFLWELLPSRGEGMINLYFIYNGHRKILIGSFGHIHGAINELKQHQASYSAVNNPRFRKSMSGENIRIDYGAVDCYYLITKKTEEK